MRISRVAVPALAIALMAGCSSSPDRAVTVGQASSSSSAAAQQTSAQPKPRGAGDELTSAQAKAGLLTVADLPTGWSAAANFPPSTNNSTVTPAVCQTVFDKMDATKAGAKATVKATASFTTGGALGQQLTMDIASFDADNQAAKIQAVATALTKCAHVTATDAKGAKVSMDMTGLSFPNLGDQTFALRVTAKSGALTIVVDLATVAIGHNFVTFTAAGLQPLPGADLEKIARAGITKVGRAAAS